MLTVFYIYNKHTKLAEMHKLHCFKGVYIGYIINLWSMSFYLMKASTHLPTVQYKQYINSTIHNITNILNINFIA